MEARAAREQQAVGFGDRQVEVLGQVDEELAIGAGPAGLDELRCLVETFASRDSSSWLRPRRVRQKRISSPAVWGSCSVWTTTRLKLPGVRSAPFPGVYSRPALHER